MKCAVIGANGQDGSYLCDNLVARGDEVWGLAASAVARYPNNASGLHYVTVDARDAQSLSAILQEIQADEVYCFAAIHGAAGFEYESRWQDALAVNVGSVHTVVEYARTAGHPVRVLYPSSSKVFVRQKGISSSTPKAASCLYSNNKISAENLLDYYGQNHGIHTAITYLFNHESPRRGATYFIPKLVQTLRHALKANDYVNKLDSLDFYCDWGDAKEYMDFAIDVLRLDAPRKVVIASGRLIYARDLAAQLFREHGLDFNDHISELHPVQDSQPVTADISELTALLGRKPERTIEEVCEQILEQMNLNTDGVTAG